MNASQIIQEIETLPRKEQAKVVRYARTLETGSRRRLSGSKLAALASRLPDAADAGEAARLRAEITRGFYGNHAHA